MLLSETAEGLLPEWAFFVKCVVNAQTLRPTASREDFYEDEALATARDTLGQCLRDYLIGSSTDEPERLQQLIQLHHLSMKALAVQDDEFYRIIIDFLPFETSLGMMTIKEFRREHGTIRYVANHDQYRQIASVAAAQGDGVIDGGYVYDADLLERYGEIFPDVPVEAVDAAGYAQAFEELTLEEQDATFELVRHGRRGAAALPLQQRHQEIFAGRKCRRCTIPAARRFLRSVERSKEVANEMWAGVLGSLSNRSSAGVHAQLIFNLRNPLVGRLAHLKNADLLKRAVQMLYVQALLLGHHPLQAKELSLLTDGLSDLIDGCLKNETRQL